MYSLQSDRLHNPRHLYFEQENCHSLLKGEWIALLPALCLASRGNVVPRHWLSPVPGLLWCRDWREPEPVSYEDA